MMVRREGGLLAWQWRGYAQAHRDRLNLWLHLFAVPAFIAGVLATVQLTWQRLWFGATIAAMVAIVAFAIQGIGHRRERTHAVPFAGTIDAIVRIFAEQFITFPRFVLSGHWLRNVSRSD